MTAIRVENLLFDFPEDWQSTKYDDWSFYRKQFQSVCSKAAAVDLLVIHPQACLWAIEAKDYRQHQRTKVIDLADEIAAKVRDSLAGLVAAAANANQFVEKNFAKQALTCPRLRVVLHLEQPQKHSKLFPRAIDPAKVTQRLKQLIKAIDPHPVVLEMKEMRNVMWKVDSAGQDN